MFPTLLKYFFISEGTVKWDKSENQRPSSQYQNAGALQRRENFPGFDLSDPSLTHIQKEANLIDSMWQFLFPVAAAKAHKATGHTAQFRELEE